MDGGVIDKLAGFGPWWLLAGFVLFLLRNELPALLGATRRDREADSLMGQMVGLFGRNLAFFEALTKQADKWVEHEKATTDAIHAMHETQRQILNEIIRQGRGER
jgi:hypothetical protein